MRLIIYPLVKKCDHFRDHFLAVTTEVAEPYEANETGVDPGTSPNNPMFCLIYVTTILFVIQQPTMLLPDLDIQIEVIIVCC